MSAGKPAAKTTAYRFGESIAVERIGPSGRVKVVYLFAYDPGKHDLSLSSAVRFRRETPRHRRWKAEEVLYDPRQNGFTGKVCGKRSLSRVPVHADTLTAAHDLFVGTLTVAGLS